MLASVAPGGAPDSAANAGREAIRDAKIEVWKQQELDMNAEIHRSQIAVSAAIEHQVHCTSTQAPVAALRFEKADRALMRAQHAKDIHQFPA